MNKLKKTSDDLVQRREGSSHTVSSSCNQSSQGKGQDKEDQATKPWYTTF